MALNGLKTSSSRGQHRCGRRAIVGETIVSVNKYLSIASSFAGCRDKHALAPIVFDIDLVTVGESDSPACNRLEVL